jgi:hypothetical protein
MADVAVVTGTSTGMGLQAAVVGLSLADIDGERVSSQTRTWIA